MSLLIVFFGTWGIKEHQAVSRPKDANITVKTPWYENKYSSPESAGTLVASGDISLIPPYMYPVPGKDNIYMRVEDGKVQGYYELSTDKDGSSYWKEVQNPDISSDYVPVKGKNNVFKNKKDGKYYKYYRDDTNDTYCFIPCDKNGKPLDTTDKKKKDATKVDKEHYALVDSNKNVYAYYPGQRTSSGAKIIGGYRKRVPDPQRKGHYLWKETKAPNLGTAAKSSNAFGGQPSNGGTQFIGGTGNTGSSAPKRVQNSDGSYTETSVQTTTKIIDGVKHIYRTTITVQWPSGKQTSHTEEIGRQNLNGPSPTVRKGQIASTLDGEVTRVTKSTKYSSKAANNLLNKVNAERVSNRRSSLRADSTLAKMAKIRAADMAMYKNADSNSQIYGDVNTMANTFHLQTGLGENRMACSSSLSATNIHMRFMAQSGYSGNILSRKFSSVGIAVAVADGQYYIVEVFG